MQQYPNFLNNCNVMMFLQLALLLLGLALYFVGRVTLRVTLLRIGKMVLKQVLVTLLMFNSFNIAFSAGLHLKYASPL